MEVLRVQKTLDQRLINFTEMFKDEPSKCSEMSSVWSAYLELVTVECPWTAFWILTERQSKQYNTFHPNSALVRVTSTNLKELTADITIESCQYDCDLPENCTVDLIDLLPTKTQPAHITASQLGFFNDWLNRCRFFYLHLWYPWDESDDETVYQWAEKHLFNRMQLYSALESRKYGRVISNILLSYVEESNDIEQYFAEVDDKPNKLLVQSYLRRSIIKEELNLLENPDMREFVIEIMKDKMQIRAEPCSALVLLSNGLRNYPELQQALEMITYRDIKEALMSCVKSSTVLLTSGCHMANNLGNLADGGFIRGIEDSVFITEEILKPMPTVLFEIYGIVSLENLTITRSKGIIFSIRGCGVLSLIKCCLKGADENIRNEFNKAIVINKGAHLTLSDCKISGFETGIVMGENSKFDIQNSEISHCRNGVVSGHPDKNVINNLVISNCENGISWTSEKPQSENLVELPGVNFENNCSNYSFVL